MCSSLIKKCSRKELINISLRWKFCPTIKLLQQHTFILKYDFKLNTECNIEFITLALVLVQKLHTYELTSFGGDCKCILLPQDRAMLVERENQQTRKQLNVFPEMSNYSLNHTVQSHISSYTNEAQHIINSSILNLKDYCRK